MTRFVVRRLFQSIPVMFGVSLIVFLMLHLIPGDPVELVTREAGGLSRETKDELREQLGFNDPLPVQYIRFLTGAVKGNLGKSIISNRPVIEVIRGKLPHTLELAGAALLLGGVFGVTFGVVAGLRAGSVWDFWAMTVALVGISTPSFVVGLGLIFVFATTLGWFPTISDAGIKGLVLPAVSMALFSQGINARLVRSTLLEVMEQEYVMTARSKGLRAASVVLRHALRNALLPAVTMMGLQIGMFVSGSVIIEVVFSRVGIGSALVQAILLKDIPVVQGILLVAVVGYVLAQLLVDITYAWLDPRIRVQ